MVHDVLQYTEQDTGYVDNDKHITADARSSLF